MDNKAEALEAVIHRQQAGLWVLGVHCKGALGGGSLEVILSFLRAQEFRCRFNLPGLGLRPSILKL